MDGRPSSKREAEGSNPSEQARGHSDNENTAGLHPADPGLNPGASTNAVSPSGRAAVS